MTGEQPTRADQSLDAGPGLAGETGRSASPRDEGYRWPAEWEAHEATWLAWPHNPRTWPGILERIPPVFERLIGTLARFEPVHVLAGPQADHVAAVARRLGGEIQVHPIPTNDAWTRDHGPTFLVRGPESPPGPESQRGLESTELAAINWRYNAWGNKYPPFDLDDAVPERIADYLGCRLFSPGIVMEGGSVDGNGQGDVLTTRSCLLHPARNPQLDEAGISDYLYRFLAARQLIWLSGEGLIGDDTDGHIDQLARFVGPDRVVAAVAHDAQDPCHAPLQANLDTLREVVLGTGRRLDVVPLPLPQPVHFDGQRLPASYCNFYIANGVVVVPQFDDPADDYAVGCLAEQFPDRNIVGIPTRDLIWGLGAFHCLTQQQPRVTAVAAASRGV